jgi:hypothetical protein
VVVIVSLILMAIPVIALAVVVVKVILFLWRVIFERRRARPYRGR